MILSKTLPSEPGFYWYQLKTSQKIRMQEVHEIHGKLMVHQGDAFVEVDKMLRLWSEKIEKPEFVKEGHI